MFSLDMSLFLICLILLSLFILDGKLYIYVYFGICIEIKINNG